VGSYVYVADFAYNVIWKILNTSPFTAEVFAGAVGEPDNIDAPAGPATIARFNKPWGLASDDTNLYLYVADTENNAIRKIEIATGIVSTLALGLDGPMGLFYYPGNGLLYCAEAYSGEVSTISLTGTITTLLANQPSGYEWPTGIVRDASNIYVVDQGVNSIWRIDAANPITATLFAGNNSYVGGWNNGTGSGAQFLYPSGLAFISADLLLVADSGNNEIRSVTVSGASVSTWAGSNTQPGTRDGLVSAMLLYGPQGIYVTPTNMVVITETGNKLVRRIQSSTGSTIAGTAPGSANGVGSAARFNVPRQLTTDGSSIWIVDGFNHVIRSLDPVSRTVATLAGVVQANQPVIEETDGTAAAALFSYPSGITQVGSLVFICDNVANTIRKLNLVTMQVTTFAGTKWSAGYTDAIGALASFNSPTSITNDGTFLYVTEYYNHTIRRIEIATADVVTIAGLHEAMGDADDPSPTLGLATDARFRFPFGITTDGTSLFIADRSNNKIRKIDIATGVVSTFAGPAPGSRSSGYVNATGNAARFLFPRGITTDGTYLYMADSYNNVIRRISIATAAVDTVAGPAAPDVKAGEIDGTGTAARFNYPNGITADGTSLYVSDIWGNTIRRIR
jgi:hypothetical protein